MSPVPGLLGAVGIGVPSSPAPGYRSWYDANQIVGLNDGDPVTTWTDLTGNGFDFTSALALRPLYKTNQLNSKPGVQFDGVDDKLVCVAAYLPTGYQHTLFMAVKNLPVPATPNSAFLFDTATAGSINRRFIQAFTLTGQPKIAAGRDGGGGSGNVNAVAAENVVATMKFDGATSLLRLNGNTGRQSTLNLSTDTTASGTAFMGCSAQTLSFAAVTILEFIVYVSALSAADIIRNEAYLLHKYALP